MLLVGNVVVLFSRFVAIFGQKYGSSNIGCIVFLTRNQMDTNIFKIVNNFFTGKIQKYYHVRFKHKALRRFRVFK